VSTLWAPDEEKVLFTCTGRIILSLSQPQRQIGFGYADHSLRLWNSDKLVATCYPCPGFLTKAAAAVDDGSVLVTGSDDCLVRVFRMCDVFTPALSSDFDDVDSEAHSSNASGSPGSVILDGGDAHAKVNTGNSMGGASSTTGSLASNQVVVSANSEAKSPFSLSLRLSGHNVPVSCVAVSRGYSIIVSGGIDGRCIIWDLNDGTFVNCLPVSSAYTSGAHSDDLRDPIVSIAIHGITGEIVACTSSRVTVWSVNGELEAVGGLDSRDPPAGDILCCAFDSEWIPGRGRVMLTGHEGGTVTVWDMEPVAIANETINLPVKNVLSAGEGTAGITALYIPYEDKSVFYAGNAFSIVTQWSVRKKN